MAIASSAYLTCGAARSQSEYTATVASPMSRHARMMRMAISPRLATRIFTGRLQGNVAVLLGWILVAFRGQAFEGGDQLGPGRPRLNDLVDVAAAGGDERVRELL